MTTGHNDSSQRLERQAGLVMAQQYCPSEDHRMGKPTRDSRLRWHTIASPVDYDSRASTKTGLTKGCSQLQQRQACREAVKLSSLASDYRGMYQGEDAGQAMQ